MANLPESSTWEAVINQIEKGDELSGGLSGNLNIAAKQLTNRTKYLHDHLKYTIIDITVSGATTNIDLLDDNQTWVIIDAQNNDSTLTFSNVPVKGEMILQIYTNYGTITLPSSFNYGDEVVSNLNRCEILLTCQTNDTGSNWTIEEKWKKDIIFDSGILWTWGKNEFGQLGDNSVTNQSSPVQIGNLSDWEIIDCGKNNMISSKKDGTLWTWGGNDYGQLGHNDTSHRSSPVQVGSLTDWGKVSAGFHHGASIKTDGTLWTWGGNDYGQLGHNNRTHRSSPVQVGSLTTWGKVQCCYNSMGAIKTDGTLWTWGYDFRGQLGHNQASETSLSSPVQVGSLTNWDELGNNVNSVICSQTDGSLWTWGSNEFGQLGLNDTVHRSSPVQIGGLFDWSLIQTGSSGCAIKTDGTLWTWGANNDGQLGLNDTSHRSSPVQVGSLTNWAFVKNNGNYMVSLSA